MSHTVSATHYDSALSGVLYQDIIKGRVIIPYLERWNPLNSRKIYDDIIKNDLDINPENVIVLDERPDIEDISNFLPEDSSIIDVFSPYDDKILPVDATSYSIMIDPLRIKKLRKWDRLVFRMLLTHWPYATDVDFIENDNGRMMMLDGYADNMQIDVYSYSSGHISGWDLKSVELQVEELQKDIAEAEKDNEESQYDEEEAMASSWLYSAKCFQESALFQMKYCQEEWLPVSELKNILETKRLSKCAKDALRFLIEHKNDFDFLHIAVNQHSILNMTVTTSTCDHLSDMQWENTEFDFPSHHDTFWTYSYKEIMDLYEIKSELHKHLRNFI